MNKNPSVAQKRFNKKLKDLNDKINLDILNKYVDDLYGYLDEELAKENDKVYNEYLRIRNMAETLMRHYTEGTPVDESLIGNGDIVFAEFVKDLYPRLMETATKKEDVLVDKWDSKLDDIVIPYVQKTRDRYFVLQGNLFMQNYNDKIRNFTCDTVNTYYNEFTVIANSYVDALMNLMSILKTSGGIKIQELEKTVEALSEELSEDKLTEKIELRKIFDYKELNKIANEYGFSYDRQKGDHGQFKNLETGQVVTIPQGRTIGKGLSLLIQKQIYGK